MPAERLALFVEQHPGDWLQWSGHNPVQSVAYARLRVSSAASVLVVWSSIGLGVYAARNTTPRKPLTMLEQAPNGSDVLEKVVYRTADVVQLGLCGLDTLPAWLVGPVCVELQRRVDKLMGIIESLDPQMSTLNSGAST